MRKNGKTSDMFISSYFSNFCNTLFSFEKIKPWVTIGFDYALKELELESHYQVSMILNQLGSLGSYQMRTSLANLMGSIFEDLSEPW